MHCHLLIPGLRPPRPMASEIGDALHLPALEALLSRGNRLEATNDRLDSWLCRQFGIARQQDWPIAPLALQADGMAPGSHYWLCADPVHLRVSLDRLTLSDGRLFTLTRTEADALLATLNRHFAADGWQFFAPRPEHWYLRLAHTPLLQTHALHEAAGSYVETCMPQGPDAPRWRALLNEVQMLLHEHPVNEAREARGELVINSIWPWGGGTWPGQPRPQFSQICANDPLTAIFAQLSATPHLPLPTDAHGWLESKPRNNALLVLDQLDLACQYGDTQTWLKQLGELEANWFVPLKQALAAGKLKKMTLHVLGAQGALRVETSRKNLWRWWRRSNLLAAPS